MKKVWIGYLRIIATIAVIVIHVSAGFVYEINFDFISTWWIGLFAAGSMRFCVPIFVMISGALLLPKQYPLKEHLQKRMFRVVLPFLFWSIIYIMVDFIVPLFNGEQLMFTSSVKHIAAGLIYGVRGHLWYVYMIIGLYLFIPIIQKWVLQYHIKEMNLYFVLWILTLVINWFIPSSPGEKGYDFEKGIDFMYFSGFLGYLVVGYYLSTKNVFNNKKGNIYSLLLILLGLLITFMGTYFVSKAANEFSRNFVRYLTPNVLFVSVGLFLFFKNNFNNTFKNHRINSAMELINKYSYGIYLSHILVLSLLAHLGIDSVFINPVIGIIITTILCLTISLFLTLMINKLPYGKYISG